MGGRKSRDKEEALPLSQLFFFLMLCVCVCLCADECTPWHMLGGGQKTICSSYLSLSTMWVSEIELGLLGLAARAPPHCTISPAQRACISKSFILRRRLV